MTNPLSRIFLFLKPVVKATSLTLCIPLRKVALSIFCAILLSNTSSAAEIELPLLGDSSSGIISKNQEYTLGKTWLQAFRSRVKQHDDPLLQAYLEHLIYDLATYSDLDNPRLTLVLINNPTINAFAAPGGIVGFHTGIFSYAENEDQMASILAHEIAHLSQRHFARGIEARRSASALSLAGLLATLVLSSTVGGDAGLAAISATQAFAVDKQLRYSRGNEQEADRMGLKTMQRAGRDPNAAADMLEEILKTSRYNGNRIPEFLLTHPVTEKRIADTRARTFSSQQRHYPDNTEFYIMQARAQVAMQKNPADSIKYYQRELEANTQQTEAAHYGLALAYLEQGNYREAERLILNLLTDKPNYLPFLHTYTEINVALQKFDRALAILEPQLALNQKSYPLRVLQAETLWKAHHYEKAAEVLTKLSKSRPEDPMIWYNLAEVRGLAGNISGVHEARAEYFILVGALDRARKQLSLALKLVKADFKRLSIVKQRLQDIADMQERLEKL